MRITAALLFLLPVGTALEAANSWSSIKEFFGINDRADPPTIQVLVIHDVPEVMLEVKGKYTLYDPNTKPNEKDKHISTRFIGKNKPMQALRGGLKWGEEFPGIYQLKITPNDDATKTYINGNEYPGTIYIYDIGGTISIVNEVNIEQYLTAFMVSQFNESAPGEALAAFAIAARTNAYAQAVNPKNNFWAVDGQKTGYQGNVESNETDWARQVVDNTKYMILSNTGLSKGVATPFSLQWGSIIFGKSAGDAPVPAAIPLEDAVRLAQDGMHAAQILSKAFPKATVMLMKYNAQ